MQKYEKGTNRLSLSRAADIAAALGTGVAGFFDDGLWQMSARADPKIIAEWSGLFGRAVGAGVLPEIASIADAAIHLREEVQLDGIDSS